MRLSLAIAALAASPAFSLSPARHYGVRPGGDAAPLALRLQTPTNSESTDNATATAALAGRVIDASGSPAEFLGAEEMRVLQEVNPFDLFQPLTCNADVDSQPCPPFSSLPVPTDGSPVAVPCGACVTMDQTGDLSLPGGLDVHGKLVFPENHKVTITAPFVYVQGVLKITNTLRIKPENLGVTFVLTGTTDRALTPHPENADACTARPESCAVGSKPFVVAGGSIDIEGMPAACPSWVTILDVDTDDVIPATFPQPVNPDGCPRALSSTDFESGISAPWRKHLGAVATVETDGSNSWMRVTNRTRSHQGMYFDPEGLRTCLREGEDYVFSARMRLTKPGGETSDCSSTGTNCPVLKTSHKDAKDKERTYTKRAMIADEGVESTDGEWFHLAGRFKFTSTEVGAGSVYVTFSISGPEPGVVMEMDDVYVGLPYEEAYPDAAAPEAICQELFPADPSADGYLDPPKYPYPLYSNRESSSTLRVMTEPVTDDQGNPVLDGNGDPVLNNFYRLSNREQEYESLSFDLTPDCVQPGSHFEVSFRARINHDLTFPNVRAEFRHSSTLVSQRCPPMGGGRGWVTCTTGITVDEAAGNADSIYFRINSQFHEDGGWPVYEDKTFDMDYDDISVRLVHGPVGGLVVDSAVGQCWGSGSEVLITSHTTEWNEDQVGVIAPEGAVVRPDGNVSVRLVNSVRRPTTAQDDPKAATELALLTRNIRLEAADDNGDNGGVLSVLNTPGVPQKLNGAEIRNFGQKGIADRYAVQFHMCASVEGSVVSQNVIRESNYRCIVVKGTHNVTVLDNIAYDTKGHCFVLQDGKETDNIFERNLGARTRSSSDSNSATFWMRAPQNSFIGNVAAGAEKRGFVLEFPRGIQSLSRDLPGSNFNPRASYIKAFIDNAAHSNDDYGFLINRINTPQEQVLRNVRSYRNEDDGMWIMGRHVVLEGAYLADNRVQNVDFDRCDSCRLYDCDIIGFSDTYRAQVVAQDIWHTCWDEKYTNRIIGIETMHYTDNNNYAAPGLNLTDVRFSGFGDTGCVRPALLSFHNNRRLPHYNVFTQFRGLTNSDGALPDLCSASNAMEVEDVLLTDLDSSLHPDGPSSFAGPSGIVTDRPWMKGFATGQCYDFPDMCMSYCEGMCLRFVNFAVNAYETEDVTLVVTDNTTTAKSIEVGGNWQCERTSGAPDVYRNTYNYDKRVFSAPLPAGTFEAKFVKNGQDYWPTFVEMTYEPAPECGGVQEGSVTVIEPAITDADCAELVRNGDGEMQGGNYTHWYHISGGVLNEAGTGVGGSTAIVSTSRDDKNDGLAFYVDTRCPKAMVGHEYELEAMFHVELNGVGFDCNPDDDSETAGCPRFTAHMKTWDATQGKFVTTYWYEIAKSVRPYNKDEYNLAQGTFVISEEMAAADSVLFTFSKTSASAKLFLDNVSLHPLESSTRTSAGCPNDLIVNGDMEDASTTTRYWDTRFNMNGQLSLIAGGADGTGHSLQISGRESATQGMRQWINPTCFTSEVEYEVYVRFKLSKGGSHITCDQNTGFGSGDSACPVAQIYAKAPDAYKYSRIADVADVGSETNWGVIHGYFTPNEEMLNSFKSYVYLEGAGPGVDIAIDDISIIPNVMDCTNLVLNGDFEVGDARSWARYGGGTSAIAVQDGGADNSAKSLIMTGRTDRAWGMEQAFNTACIEVGDQYLVEAKVKMMQGETTFTCNSNMVFGTEGCPVASIVSDQAEVRVRDVAAVLGSADADGWYHMHGIFEFFDFDKESNQVLVRFKDAPVNVDLIVDDVVISKVDASSQ